MTAERLIPHLTMTLEGIFGTAVDVSATLIILFTIYGAILQNSGAGKFFVDFSFAVTGGKPDLRRAHGGAVLLPAGRALGLRRGHHGDARHRRLADDAEAWAIRRTTQAACWRRAVSAPSSRRPCWGPPPS